MLLKFNKNGYSTLTLKSLLFRDTKHKKKVKLKLLFQKLQQQCFNTHTISFEYYVKQVERHKYNLSKKFIRIK